MACVADISIEKCAERGKLLEKLLKERVGGHKNVGNIRGMGLFWGVEIVKDKATKQPYKWTEGINAKIGDAALARGVAVYYGSGCVSVCERCEQDSSWRFSGKGSADAQADGWDGDQIMICPPYTITEDEVERVVDTVKEAIDEVLGN